MLEQAIMELQNIEQSLAKKTLSDLKIHLVLRSCLKELRALSVACHLANRGGDFRPVALLQPKSP